jgi:ribosomal protein S18 acetylase RimI-like enzyme
MIFLLLQENKIKLEDDITSYIPELTLHEVITIDSLLTNRSGLPDIYNQTMQIYQKEEFYLGKTLIEKQLYDLNYSYSIYSDKEVINFVNNNECSKIKTINHYQVNITLLRIVIEKVTNLSFYQCLCKYIFTPLKISILEENDSPLIGYINFDDNLPTKLSITGNNLPSFSLKLEDLIKFYKALVTGKLINKKNIKLLLDPNKDYYGLIFEDDGCYLSILLKDRGIGSYCNYNQDLDLFYCYIWNYPGSRIPKPLRYGSFSNSIKDLITSAFFNYSHPKLVPLNRNYIDQALCLELHDYQYKYTSNGAGTIGWCYSEKNSHIYVLVDSNLVLGLCNLWIDKKHSDYRITSVLIDKKYQSKGYGTFLVNKATQILQKKGANKIIIGVDKGNTVALKVYLKCGYKIMTTDAYGYDLQKVLND